LLLKSFFAETFIFRKNQSDFVAFFIKKWDVIREEKKLDGYPYQIIDAESKSENRFQFVLCVHELCYPKSKKCHYALFS